MTLLRTTVGSRKDEARIVKSRLADPTHPTRMGFGAGFQCYGLDPKPMRVGLELVWVDPNQTHDQSAIFIVDF